MTIRQGATLNLGSNVASVGAFNNNGTVSGNAGQVFTVGANNGTGTSYGVISGNLNVLKNGTGAQSWLGQSTYTEIPLSIVPVWLPLTSSRTVASPVVSVPRVMLRRILFSRVPPVIGLSGCSADCRDEFVDKRFGIFDDRPFVHDDGYRSYSVKHCWQ